MRIYAVADIHGKPEKVEKILAVIRQNKPDILVIAGDMISFRMQKQVQKLFQMISIPILGVWGNSDFKYFRSGFLANTNVQILNTTPVTLFHQRFIGLNGTVVLPFNTRVKWFESKMITKVQKQIDDRTILVSHPPPRGFTDRVTNRFHAGSTAVKRIITGHQPLMVICGHIHEQAGIDYFKTTPIINCAMNKNHGGTIIDCAENKISNIEQILI